MPPELQSPHLHGNVYGNERFPDGTYVHTSRIIGIEDKGTHKAATTASGSIYELQKRMLTRRRNGNSRDIMSG